MDTGSGKHQEPAHDLWSRAHVELLRVLGSIPARSLIVDVARQHLVLITDGTVAGSWPVSTAAAGVNAHEGSQGTPPGVHLIAERIGMDQPLGTEFVSRVPTGRILPLDTLPQEPGLDLILSRILTLSGCEDGVNRGVGIGSLERYIYLHGTNREDLLGRPVSHGCIRLANADISKVCDLVREGDPVVIL